MLADKYNDKTLEALLPPITAYHPFPTADERKAWDNLNPALRQSLISRGEQYLEMQWPSLPATLFMEFKRNGNRSNFESLYFLRRHALVAMILAECIEGSGRFIDQIINGIWCICEESFWGVSAHNIVSQYPGASLPDVTEPIIDLFAAETAGLLAWTHYLLRNRLDAVTPVISHRIRHEINRRILTPYLERDDFKWMGFIPNHRVNNWNPWCNSNCLTAFLLIEEDDNRRKQAVAKVMRSLDRFLDGYKEDGGCDEGASYWGKAGASLFDCLELLYSVSEGRIDVYTEPLIQNIGRFIYRVHIADNYFVNFADCGAKVNIPAALVYRYGKRIKDPKMMAMGESAYQMQCYGDKSNADSVLRIRDVPDPLLRELPFIFCYDEIESARSKPPYERDTWLAGIQVMTARERQGTCRGLYIAAKGGNNNESHNHNDIGQFIVFSDGMPIIADVGVETYTAKTFSQRRYELWTMQSAYHNLPTINGFQQQAGESYKATDVRYRADDAQAELSLNIESAYPPSAGILSWRRHCCLNRAEQPYVEIIDEFEVTEPTSDITMTLMTPCLPDISERGAINLNATCQDIAVLYDAQKLEPSYERIEINDAKLRAIWGGRIFRILLKSKQTVKNDIWTMRIVDNI